MKKETKKYFAAHGSKQEEPEWLQGLGNSPEDEELQSLVELPKVRVYDGKPSHPVDEYTRCIWDEREPNWFDERLHNQIEDMLRGLNRRMAQEVIECLTFYINWGSRTYLGLWHIDGMLKTAYNKIEYAASKQGI